MVLLEQPLELLGRLLSFPNLFIGSFGLLLILCTWTITNRLNNHVFWVAFVLTCLEAVCVVLPLYFYLVRRKKTEYSAL